MLKIICANCLSPAKFTVWRQETGFTRIKAWCPCTKRYKERQRKYKPHKLKITVPPAFAYYIQTFGGLPPPFSPTGRLGVLTIHSKQPPHYKWFPPLDALETPPRGFVGIAMGFQQTPYYAELSQC